MAKRLMCVILSVMLVVAMMPTAAFADDDYVASVTIGNETTCYTTIADAVTAANNAASDPTITLLADVTVTSNISIKSGTSKNGVYSFVNTTTLDLNGFTLTLSGCYIAANTNLIIDDTSESGSGSIIGENQSFTYNCLVKTGTYQNSSSVQVPSTVTIRGGTLTSAYYCIYFSNTYGGTVNIEGGTLTTTGTGYYAICANLTSSKTASINISGGTVGSIYAGGTTGTCNLSISGGEVTESIVLNTSYTTIDCTVTGGTFSSSAYSTISSYISESEDVTTNEDGTYTVGAVSYTLTYSANGGTGTVTEATAYDEGTEVAVASGDGLTLDGYTFNGWNTASDGSGNSYAAGESIIITADTTLYAQWTAISYVTGFNVNLGSYLAMGFYLPADNFDVSDGSVYTVTITQTYSDNYDDGGITKGQARPVSYTISSDTISGLTILDYFGDCYFFEIDGINAKEMADDIVVTVKKGDTLVYTSSTTSIANYGSVYITYFSDDVDGIALVEALLNYGAAAQTYFDYNTDNPATNYIPAE